ncbi:hypothetical protein RIF29_00434 [Crotalaria pallida]|uniref:Uncharacterized protein n=1 Tax=Crotalaria pallida TaxID=3830 RepID=A0AAN9P7G0_CROPI
MVVPRSEGDGVEDTQQMVVSLFLALFFCDEWRIPNRGRRTRNAHPVAIITGASRGGHKSESALMVVVGPCSGGGFKPQGRGSHNIAVWRRRSILTSVIEARLQLRLSRLSSMITTT